MTNICVNTKIILDGTTVENKGKLILTNICVIRVANMNSNTPDIFNFKFSRYLYKVKK